MWEWQAARERAQYRRRVAEASPLYHLVYHYRDELPLVWEHRFQAEYGVLRGEVLDALDAFLNCGILAHGCARAYCEHCKHSELIAFSCKKRGICPSCEAKRALIYAETLHEKILSPTPHRHIVFSIPKILRAYFRYDRELHRLIFDAAWESLREWYELRLPGSVPGSVFSIQTAGASLNHNPHIHGIVLDGAFTPPGEFEQLGYIDTAEINARFGELLVQSMLYENLISSDTVELLNSWSHSGFNLWAGSPITPDDANARRFIARYIDRGPIALSRIQITNDIITYNADDELTHEFDPLELLARISVHIPNKWEQTLRYLGWYSARTRGARRAREEITLVELSREQLEESKKPSRSWAQLIKRVYEVNPLACPKCNSEMKIVAFITDYKAIKKITDNLGIAPSRAPPPFPKRHSQSEFFTD